MIYFFKPLPANDMDFSDYKPFIQNEWFRKNFMKFVYVLQLLLILLSIAFGVWDFSNWFIKIIVFGATFTCHELLHILAVYKKGDISLTRAGIFFWLNSSAIMSKKRFLFFMILPFTVLTVIPLFLLFLTDGYLFRILRYIVWVNAIISGSDIINSLLIALKPSHAKFCRGYYILEK